LRAAAAFYRPGVLLIHPGVLRQPIEEKKSIPGHSAVWLDSETARTLPGARRRSETTVA
jgi:hypothetical protein